MPIHRDATGPWTKPLRGIGAFPSSLMLRGALLLNLSRMDGPSTEHPFNLCCSDRHFRECEILHEKHPPSTAARHTLVLWVRR